MHSIEYRMQIIRNLISLYFIYTNRVRSTDSIQTDHRPEAQYTVTKFIELTILLVITIKDPIL